jgi:hypothetical protein
MEIQMVVLKTSHRHFRWMAAFLISGLPNYGQSNGASGIPQMQRIAGTREFQWGRLYRFDWDPVHKFKLGSGGRVWGLKKEEIKPGPDNSYWVEYIPKTGPSIWIPGGPSYVIGGSDGDESSQTRNPGSGIGPFLGFEIPSDIDGKGYRVWSPDRTQVIREESFPEEDFKNVEVRLEPWGDDSMVVHVNHPKVLSMAIQFSLDGESWSDARKIGNHYRHVDLNRGEGKHPADLHLPVWILRENPHPLVEVDIQIGLTIITRRFKYGESQDPLKGVFPVRTGPEPEWVRVERDRQSKVQKYQEKHEAERQGMVWAPKPIEAKAATKVLRWSADLF